MLRDTAYFLHGELERNWACNEDPYYATRRRNINQMTNASHRIGEGLMLSFARSYPDFTSKLLKRKLNGELGYRLAGAGSVNTTVTDETDVFKIHRRSSFMGAFERTGLTETYQDHHNVLKKYMGEMTVSQAVRVMPNILNPKRLAITTIQKFYEFEDPNLFDGYDKHVDATAFETCKARYPGIESALRDMAVAGLKMYEEQSLLPDTSGLNNVVIIDGNLKIIDGVPILPTNPSDAIRITSQLQSALALTS